MQGFLTTALLVAQSFQGLCKNLVLQSLLPLFTNHGKIPILLPHSTMCNPIAGVVRAKNYVWSPKFFSPFSHFLV